LAIRWLFDRFERTVPDGEHVLAGGAFPAENELLVNQPRLEAACNPVLVDEMAATGAAVPYCLG